MDHIFTPALPGIDTHLLQSWLGRRWLAVPRAHYAQSNRWSSIISSRISRTKPQFHDWPAALSRALQRLERQRQTCLIVPGTTTACWLQAATRLRSQATLQVQLAEGHDVHQWRAEVLQVVRTDPIACRDRLFVSPVDNTLDVCASDVCASDVCASDVCASDVCASDVCASDVCASDVCASDVCASDAQAADWTGQVLAELPIEDRLAIALAHSVLALSIRAHGVLERLLQMRLDDSRFPPGTVSVRVGHTQLGRAQATQISWLDRHAVGWYLPVTEQRTLSSREHALACRRAQATQVRGATTQWTAPIELVSNWDHYLVHCVRGDQGRTDKRVTRAELIDALLCGRFPKLSAYQTLLTILQTGRLRAQNHLLRGWLPLVSFSAVPLPELLARRSFQSHLSRWDWEPYGLLVDRNYLQSAGARPVIYGDQAVYDQLADSDRPFYQPALRRSALHDLSHPVSSQPAGADDWQAECEWRLPGDLRLADLPPESLRLFVEYEHQAQALAQESRWPVIWQKRSQTQRLPAPSMHRRHSRAGTSRN